jgi:hypothetical protein
MTETNTRAMIFPTIHLNGTSKQQLLDDYCDVSHALNAAMEKMIENGPNGRDYYPQGDQAFQQAVKEHHDRIEQIHRVRLEIETIAEHIADA